MKAKKQPPKNQYGGDGLYYLLDNGERHGRKVNALYMNAKDAKERNTERKKHYILAQWWWSGRRK